jgi:ATP-binding protein involved in chromosome partitioning
MDPRLVLIDDRFKNIKHIIAVAGGKGGIGKSMISSTLALTLAEMGYKVGLLDLDFCGPSAHAILGIHGVYPKEEKGIIPPNIHGINFMSIVYYAGNNPSPLRGIDISNAMIELFAITRWSSLDFLIIDSPPGIGDTLLDIIRLLKRTEFLIVTTPSQVALATVEKTLRLLKEMKAPIIGVIENMKIVKSSHVEEQMIAIEVPFLGEIDFDRNLEGAIGDSRKLLNTDFAQSLKVTISNIPIFKP